MELIEKTPELLPTLRSFDPFKDIEENALRWLIDKSEYKSYAPGDHLFVAGEAADHMQIIIAGRYRIWLDQNGERREVGNWGTGYITGVLPFSRMVKARGTGQAEVETRVLELHRRHFTEMVSVSYELTQSLVAFMSGRIREFYQIRSQNEKLMALGKLSAGLAHELNNPASAIVRSAKELYEKIHYTPEKFKAVITMRITSEQTDRINAILYERLQSPPEDLSILERQDALDDLLDWLDEHGVEDPDDIAETFVDFGLDAEDLKTVWQILKGEHLPTILWWLESTLDLERLVREIQDSAGRIAELVGSVKTYTHMDRGVAMEATDIRDGIRNTLAMLRHKLKHKNIRIHKEFDPELPPLQAFVGELNQVWTNLIGNAIDAMEKDGNLTLRTFREDEQICVEVIDDGHGIPADIQEEIFDPFFTTKSIAEGTGMGLEITRQIVDRHDGSITLESIPGRTVFRVCLPISSS